jgi:hypothetical protein
MAIDFLFERGKLPDWKEFAAVLATDRNVAEETLVVCRYHQNSGSVKLAQLLVQDNYPEITQNKN